MLLTSAIRRRKCALKPITNVREFAKHAQRRNTRACANGLGWVCCIDNIYACDVLCVYAPGMNTIGFYVRQRKRDTQHTTRTRKQEGDGEWRAGLGSGRRTRVRALLKAGPTHARVRYTSYMFYAYAYDAQIIGEETGGRSAPCARTTYIFSFSFLGISSMAVLYMVYSDM